MNKTKIITMILIGSVLETYDYSLYGYFASLLGQQFFPTSSANSSLLIAFSVFALGFLARPIGALIFGHYGDKFGRKKMLVVSIMLMAIPTACIGLLPTYSYLGIYAGILLISCRLIQGIAVGAEFVGTMVYMVEIAPKEHRSFYGSLCICSGYFAMLLTAGVFGLLNYLLTSTQLETWGWRCAFLFGIVLGVIGLWLRSGIPETATFKHLQARNFTASKPLFQLARYHPMQVLQGIGLTTFHVVGFYILFVYMHSYLVGTYHLTGSLVNFTNIVTLIGALVFLPILGLLADYFSQRKLIWLSCTVTVCSVSALFVLLHQGSVFSLMLMQLSLTFLLCMTSAALPAYLATLFPASVRFSGMAISYNTAAVVFGGTAPLLMTWLVQQNHFSHIPGYYLMFAALLTLLCALPKQQHE